MSSNSVRHNDYLNLFIRSYDVKSLQSVIYSVVEGKTEEAYVIVRNSRNYPTEKDSRKDEKRSYGEINENLLTKKRFEVTEKGNH